MPRCGRMDLIESSEMLGRWRFVATVLPLSLRTKLMRTLQMALGDQVVVAPGMNANEIIVTSGESDWERPTHRLLNLLAQHVTIEDDTDASHALAVHTLFDSQVDDGNGVKSYIGEVVSDAKYSRDSWSEAHLAELMTEFVDSHPLFRRATHITCPPGSSGGNNTSGLAHRLVEHTNARLGLQFVTIQGMSRVPRKSKRHSNDCSDVNGTFQVSQRVEGATVLVLDDLYGHGCTVNEVARSLRAARVRQVLALSGSKDATGCEGLPPHQGNWHDWHPPNLDLPFQ